MKGLNKLVGLPIPWFPIVSIVLLIGSVATVVTLTGLQQPDSSIRDGSSKFLIATEELSTGQDVVISVSSATFYLPKDAIPMAGTIYVAWRPPNLFSGGIGSYWSRPMVVNILYLDDYGIPYLNVTLSKSARLCFMLSDEEWLDYLNRPNEYQLQFYAEKEATPRWKSLPTEANPEQNELCGEIKHFSLFALAIRQSEPAIPITGLNPTPIPTPTPAPKTLITILSNFFNHGSNGSSNGGASDVYEP